MKKQNQLIIGKKIKQKLNKQQQTFNRLINKLEKLQSEKEKTAKDLNEKLDYYGKYISPLEIKISSLHSRSAKIFYEFYKTRGEKLSDIDKEALKAMITAQINQFSDFSREEYDDELKEIIEFLEGESYEELVESDFQAIKNDMSETFKEMGFDVDLDDLSSDLSEEEIIRKMFEKVGSVKEQIEDKENAEPKRKKTKKQIEKEEREKEVEEAKHKSIAGIYKSLAKVFHPDLERDAEKQKEKEVLMKRLTAAYKENDLHTLLVLELEWLQKEEDDLEKLSDEKLKIYNQALKEQTEDLEAQIFFTEQHPRYFPLQKYFSFFGVKGLNLKSEKKKLEEKIKWMESDIEDLTSRGKIGKLNEILGIVKDQLRNEDVFGNIRIEDLLENLFE